MQILLHYALSLYRSIDLSIYLSHTHTHSLPLFHSQSIHLSIYLSQLIVTIDMYFLTVFSFTPSPLSPPSLSISHTIHLSINRSIFFLLILYFDMYFLTVYFLSLSHSFSLSLSLSLFYTHTHRIYLSIYLSISANCN